MNDSELRIKKEQLAMKIRSQRQKIQTLENEYDAIDRELAIRFNKSQDWSMKEDSQSYSASWTR